MISVVIVYDDNKNRNVHTGLFFCCMVECATPFRPIKPYALSGLIVSRSPLSPILVRIPLTKLPQPRHLLQNILHRVVSLGFENIEGLRRCDLSRFESFQPLFVILRMPIVENQIIVIIAIQQLSTIIGVLLWSLILSFNSFNPIRAGLYARI